MATKKTASERAIAKLTAAGHKPFSYSGRGMYGAECVAVAIDELNGDLRKLGGSAPRRDSLGKKLVAYWPGLPWPKDEPTAEPEPAPAPKTVKRTFTVTFEVEGEDAALAEGTVDDLLDEGEIQKLVAELAADQDKDFEIVAVYT